MHADEFETDESLVRGLLAAQCPQWSALPISRVPSAGTDHALYLLGTDLVARLPRRPSAVPSLEKELEWLAKLAPELPVEIPVPLAKGRPGEGYPWPWGVYPWLRGEHPSHESPDLAALARDLAAFIAALERVDPGGGPKPGAHNFGRGVDLAARDGFTRKAIGVLADSLDGAALTRAWERDLAAPTSERRVWIHGDLKRENLLVERGRLHGVIDFGGLGVGDPAVDLLPAWDLLARERAAFRAALGVDAATWARGRGWALSVALIALAYYKETNPVIAAQSRLAIAEVLGDRS
jgi:aminoglycoside phosphotransferase (APT) family kinase protein